MNDNAHERDGRRMDETAFARYLSTHRAAETPSAGGQADEKMPEQAIAKLTAAALGEN